MGNVGFLNEDSSAILHRLHTGADAPYKLAYGTIFEQQAHPQNEEDDKERAKEDKNVNQRQRRLALASMAGKEPVDYREASLHRHL